MTGKKVKETPKSATELALEQAQLDAVTQQNSIVSETQRLNELLQPILLAEIGLTPQLDETGKIIGFTKDADPQAEAAEAARKQLETQTLEQLLAGAETRGEIDELFLERTRAALAGELPVNPALIRNLDEEEAELNARLRDRLGPGFDVSSPGIEALADFNQRKTEVLEAARRGDLSLSEQLGQARTAQNIGIGEQAGATLRTNLQQFLGNAGQTLVGTPLGIASGGFGNLVQSQQIPLQNFIQGRQFSTNVAFQNAQLASSGINSLLGGAGALAGSYLGNPSVFS